MFASPITAGNHARGACGVPAMMRAVCIGECMVELRTIDGDSFARSYAGDVYNTAVYLKRSLPEASVQFLSATGDDAMSRSMRAAWRAHDIDDSLAFTVKGGSPGLYLIETDAAGERRFQYWRNDSAARRWLTLLLAHGESVLAGADIVYISGIALAILRPEERLHAIEMLRRLRGRVGHIAFDPNVRAALWENRETAAATISAALAASDAALPSTEDLRWLFDIQAPAQQMELLQENGVQEMAITLGPNGCLVSDGKTRTLIPCPNAPSVVDTSGAGDSFNGAYLAKRLQGGSPLQAAHAGLAVASRVVTHAGAIVPASTSHPSTHA
jgi:2-dehydro-3-deoxygluconokinase